MSALALILSDKEMHILIGNALKYLNNMLTWTCTSLRKQQ